MNKKDKIEVLNKLKQKLDHVGVEVGLWETVVPDFFQTQLVVSFNYVADMLIDMVAEKVGSCPETLSVFILEYEWGDLHPMVLSDNGHNEVSICSVEDYVDYLCFNNEGVH